MSLRNFLLLRSKLLNFPMQADLFNQVVWEIAQLTIDLFPIEKELLIYNMNKMICRRLGIILTAEETQQHIYCLRLFIRESLAMLKNHILPNLQNMESKIRMYQLQADLYLSSVEIENGIKLKIDAFNFLEAFYIAGKYLKSLLPPEHEIHQTFESRFAQYIQIYLLQPLNTCYSARIFLDEMNAAVLEFVALQPVTTG